MGWNQADLWDDGWETAARVGSSSFICMSLVLALWPVFSAAPRTFGPSSLQKYLLCVGDSCLEDLGARGAPAFPNVPSVLTFGFPPPCAVGRQEGLHGEGYLGDLWSASTISMLPLGIFPPGHGITFVM